MYIQDEEFSSLNSTSAECFSTKALVAEFIEWLDYAENQLDSVCYCAKIATSSTLCDKPNIEKLSDDYTEDHSCEEQSCDNNLDCVNNGSTPLNCHIRSDALVDGCVNEQQRQQQHQRRKVVEQNVVIGLGQHETDDVGDVDNGCNSYATEDHEYEGVDVFYDDDDDDVDDELMMSLEMTTATSSSQPKSTKSNNPTPTKPCLSETVADWSVILTRYKVSAIYLLPCPYFVATIATNLFIIQIISSYMIRCVHRSSCEYALLYIFVPVPKVQHPQWLRVALFELLNEPIDYYCSYTA